MKTFSVGFEAAELRREPVRRARSRELYGTDHHELILTPPRWSSFRASSGTTASRSRTRSRSSELPLSPSSPRRHVTVALAGDGGDESFAGYHRYERVAAYEGDSTPRPGLQPGDEHLLTFFSHLLSWDYFGSPERPSFYTPEFLAELGERPFLSVLADPYLESDAQDDLGRIIDVDLQTRLAQDILVKVDIASMAHSLEVRSPLLDQVLVEIAAAIPSHHKLRGAETKRILKGALREWLPDRILDRAKMGFAVPLCAWFRNERSELPREVLLDPRALERGLFRPERIHQLLDEHRDGRADHAGKIWAMLQLELWLQMYVDPARIDSAVTV